MVITTYQLLSPTPFDGIARIAESFPIEATVLTVTGFALQSICRGLDHVGCGPVHVGFCKAVLTAISKACDRRSHLEGAVPVESRPEAVLAGSDRLEKVVVHRVIRLPGNVQFEREDFRCRIIDIARGLVDV